MSPHTFTADAVLFDMDGTLTDSIQAVEAAWGKVAKDIGQDPAHVIAATHGKRAVDNLSQFKPQIKSNEMEDEVQNFEESILYFADAYNLHGPGSRRGSRRGSMANSPEDTPHDSGSSTPALTRGNSSSSSVASSRSASFVNGARRSSFGSKLSNRLASMTMTALPENKEVKHKFVIGPEDESAVEEDSEDVVYVENNEGKYLRHRLEAWQVEAGAVDRSVRILPGVKKMIASLPEGRYAVATSGAKTYAHGCMTRVGITPPPVTITADDKRLKAGKPAPDPFLLAAKCLGYDAKNCVVFEDSPSGIRAGVASGATVIAVCTSHERSKIENCGAHYVVENMDLVKCDFVDGKLKFTVSA